MKFSVNIGLLGCGSVGSEVAKRLLRDRERIERRSGVRYSLRSIAVANRERSRHHSIPRELLTTDASSVVGDPHIDLVIECIGGSDEPVDLIEQALDRGRHVVTANKDVLGTQGPRLAALAALRGVSLRYEAAVGGAVPIVRAVREAFTGDHIIGIAGVFNGTCTSILSAMENGTSYDDALSHAQRLGYAEADPASDVDGSDSAHKLAILMQLGFNLAVLSPRISRSGIAGVTPDQIGRCKELGLRVRLVAAAIVTSDGVLAEVAPLAVPQHHTFARTAGADNVARIIARDAGAIELRGAGAGGIATSSAVLADVVSTLRAIGERHDFTHRCSFPKPAPSVRPLFDGLPRSGIAQVPLWDEGIVLARARSTAQPWPELARSPA